MVDVLYPQMILVVVGGALLEVVEDNSRVLQALDRDGAGRAFDEGTVAGALMLPGGKDRHPMKVEVVADALVLP